MTPGRTQAEARGIRRPKRSVRVVIGAVPSAKTAAVERREASVSRGRLRRRCKLVYGARRAPRLASVEWLMRLPALRSLGHFSGDEKDRRTRRLTKTRADDAWLFDRLNPLLSSC